SSTQSIGATRFQQQSSPPGPPPATEKDIALGLNHFEAHCAGCHGETGKADTEKARLVRAANLTGEQVQAKPDDELFRIISRGVPGTAMPGFANSHSPEEIRQTILFLRKLPKLTSQERAKLEAAVPPEARHRSSTEYQHSETTEALPGQ